MLSRLVVFRCFPTLFGFLVFFFFLVDWSMRDFLPCIPPLAMSNDVVAVLDCIVAIDGQEENAPIIVLHRTLNVNAQHDILVCRLPTKQNVIRDAMYVYGRFRLCIIVNESQQLRSMESVEVCVSR